MGVGAFGVSSPLGASFNPAYIDPALSQQQTVERLGLANLFQGLEAWFLRILFAKPCLETLVPSTPIIALLVSAAATEAVMKTIWTINSSRSDRSVRVRLLRLSTHLVKR